MTEAVDASPVTFPARDLSSPVCCMMYSAYKLNKQGDSIQLWHTPFSILNQSIVPCTVLIVASWTAYRFLRKQVRWSGFSFRIFHGFFVIHKVKGFSIVNEADVFLEFSCFFYDLMDVGYLISYSSAFCKPILYIWKYILSCYYCHTNGCIYSICCFAATLCCQTYRGWLSMSFDEGERYKSHMC